MAKYRKKPVVIEAVQWTGDPECVAGLDWIAFTPGMVERIDKGIEIRTLEGTMLASVGDWIIRGVKGEVYPCKPDIFAATYDPVEEHATVTT